ncbi:MAG: hypothetical protein AB7F86_10295 [Bdellovibrionales bacterium]
MKFMAMILLFLVGAPVWASTQSVHPASAWVQETLELSKAVLEEKEEFDRFNGMCALLTNRLGSNTISSIWLGQYGQLNRNADASAEFRSMIPSILMSKAVPVLGGAADGEFIVDGVAQERSTGVYEVGVTVISSGRQYKGMAVIEDDGAGSFRLIDGEYMGLSVVNYQAREYLNFMKRVYDKDPVHSLPVSALVQHIRSQSDYRPCP